MTFLLMCIGNRFGGDDAVGPYIADKLNLKKLDDIKVVNCETTPENYTSVVKKLNPDLLIIIDAVEMELNAGEIRIVPKNRIGKFCVSTHGIPISLIIDYLKQYIKKIIFIGIQPKQMDGKLTKSVKKSADDLIDIILEKNFDNIKILK